MMRHFMVRNVLYLEQFQNHLLGHLRRQSLHTSSSLESTSRKTGIWSKSAQAAMKRFVKKMYPKISKQFPEASVSDKQVLISEEWNKLSEKQKEQYIPKKEKKKSTDTAGKKQYTRRKDGKLSYPLAVKRLRIHLGFPKIPSSAFMLYYEEQQKSLQSGETLGNKECKHRWDHLPNEPKQEYMLKYENITKEHTAKLALWKKEMIRKGIPEILEPVDIKKPAPILLSLIKLKGWKVRDVEEDDDKDCKDT